MSKSKKVISIIKRSLLALAVIYIAYLIFGFIVVSRAFKIQKSENDIRRMAHSLIEFHPVYGIYKGTSSQSDDVNALLKLSDSWNNPVQFYWSETNFVLAYAGPDKKRCTQDDMAIEYEWWDLERMGKFPQRFSGHFTGWHSGEGGGTHIVSYKGGARILRTEPDYSWTNWNYMIGH